MAPPAPSPYNRQAVAPHPPDSADEGEPRTRAALHLGLFLLTCATTYFSGAGFGGDHDPASGIAFAGTLMTILVCHEMGHYVVARRHGIDASLPFFIPLPPMISLGTMGAVIRMKDTISDRNQLIDVGAAGPLAGLAVAVPLLVWGLSLSPVEVSAAGEGALVEGNSLLYVGLKYLVHGQYLPGADGADVQLHPIAFAAWVGLLITMINLIPIGQLDGGHIACGYLGERHERLSSTLHWLLLAVGGGVMLGLTAEALAAGRPIASAASRALWAGMPWLVWAGLLGFLRRAGDGRYHPPVGAAPLSPGRRRLVWLIAIVFVLIFTPIPLREAL